MWPFTSSNAPIIAQKRTERDRALATATATPLSQLADAFTKATASEIVHKIQEGTWTATQVVEAYISNAARAHGVTNCLTEVLFERARAGARELDIEFAHTGKIRGPLHGVPVSFKDQFEMAGVDASIGFTQWADKPCTTDADLVKQFRAAGAVILTKTNVPQTMLAFECSNPLFGTTTNPWNDRFTPGGSSGGEGAMLAMDGSVIGIGSDIGGSLRIPASYCGVYALKPTIGRMSHQGARSPTPGFEGIKTVVGPMARTVADLELVARMTFGVTGSSTDMAPLPFRPVTLPKKLKFGYYTSDLYVKASPACKRAVLETVNALRKEGHECVEFIPPNTAEAFGIFVALTSADRYDTLLSHLGPDKKEDSLFLVSLGPKIPGWLRRVAAWCIETFVGDKLFANTVRQSRGKSTSEYYKWVAQKQRFVKSWYEQVWNKHQFDGIIAPVQAVPCIAHGGCTTLSPLATATILWNVIDSSVGCLPVTRVDAVEDVVTDEWFNGPGLGSKSVEAQLYRGSSPAYNPKAMEGLPVGVQIVGRAWEDEKVLAMMDVVDKALGERGFGPGSWASMKAAA